jgi:flagellum-specific ATP synthase
VEIGAYVPGSNPLVDRALDKSAAIDQFLRQPVDAVADPAQSWAQLHDLVVSA